MFNSSILSPFFDNKKYFFIPSIFRKDFKLQKFLKYPGLNNTEKVEENFFNLKFRILGSNFIPREISIVYLTKSNS